MADDTTATTTTTTDVGKTTGTTAATPWYEGKADPEVSGYWDNKGWAKDDATKIAIEATKRARQLESHYGVPAEQLMKLPRADAGPEAWKAVFERLGMPKDAAGYDFGDAAKDLDETFVSTMRDAMHKANVPKDAASEIAKSLSKWFNDTDAHETAAKAAQLQTDRSELAREWGREFEFNRLTAMQGVRRAVGSDEAAGKVIDAMASTLGYKATMEFWRRIGAGTNEDTFVTGGQGGMVTTVNGAREKIAELQTDSNFVKRYLAGETQARREMDNLLQLAHGEPT